MSTIRVVSRLSTLRCKFKSNSSVVNLFKSTFSSQASASPNRIPRISNSRLPVETSCLLAMFPLHNAIASAKLQSLLSVDSQSWCLVPQEYEMDPQKDYICADGSHKKSGKRTNFGGSLLALMDMILGRVTESSGLASPQARLIQALFDIGDLQSELEPDYV
ncbi:hypothetical protein Cgig2_009997 [Carnegiea gigantea]|uniref:Uncharacterized protein n=1 Tax=Carnegiea gigantea TaxID=171969 RepID=A0A9Q1JWJ4_9CARY|nr:hypothetical protein Cgig2_009997 [Carnegiea gigantea]